MRTSRRTAWCCGGFTPTIWSWSRRWDGDPQVKRYIDGGVPVDRQGLAETLRWWLGYYDRGEWYGFWAAIEKSSGRFIGWFHLRPGEGADPSSLSSATGCDVMPGVRATPPRVPGR